MTARVDLTPEAEADVDEAHAWYAEREPGLAEDFRRALDECMASIAAHPESHPVVRHSIRRALLRRFPYCVFYVVEPERIVIQACFHARRNPQSWRVRSG